MLSSKGIQLTTSHAERTQADDETLPYPTPLSNPVINHLISLFRGYEDPIKKYLILLYKLPGFNVIGLSK